jgi:hypothetical protein
VVNQGSERASCLNATRACKPHSNSSRFPPATHTHSLQHQCPQLSHLPPQCIHLSLHPTTYTLPPFLSSLPFPTLCGAPLWRPSLRFLPPAPVPPHGKALGVYPQHMEEGREEVREAAFHPPAHIYVRGEKEKGGRLRDCVRVCVWGGGDKSLLCVHHACTYIRHTPRHTRMRARGRAQQEDLSFDCNARDGVRRGVHTHTPPHRGIVASISSIATAFDTCILAPWSSVT